MKRSWQALIILVVVFLVMGIALLGACLVFLADKDGAGGDGQVAVVEIIGEIYETEPTIELLEKYGKQEQVKALVIRIDSPGGSVVASQEIYDAIRRIREEGKKPVVASLGNVAASGGYYVACGAGHIVANPGTITGSVGVMISFLNLEGLLGKVGVKIRNVTSGEHKDLGTFTRELTPAEEALIQGVLDDIHQQFVQAVADGRGLTPEEVMEMADGRIFTGRQAKELGLVDELGNQSDAIDRAAELANLEKWDVVKEEKKLPLLARLLGFEGKLLPLRESTGAKYLMY